MDRRLPGDELLPAAPLVMDRRAGLPAPPERAWPWVLQLGKDRAGWYLPRSVERFLPPGHRAIRHIDPRFQGVAVGDRVPDYGRRGWFEARTIDPPNALVWFSERGRDLCFSSALVLEPVGTAASELLIRLRISRHIGRRAPALSERAGELFDLVTIRLMIAGLRERLLES